MSSRKGLLFINAILLLIILSVVQDTVCAKEAKKAVPPIDGEAAFALIKSGSYKEIKRQINGMTLFAIDEAGDTLLMTAIKEKRDYKIIKYLLRSVGVDAENHAGETAISYVCLYSDNARTVRHVFDQGIVLRSRVRNRLLHINKRGVAAFERADENPSPIPRRIARTYLSKRTLRRFNANRPPITPDKTDVTVEPAPPPPPPPVPPAPATTEIEIEEEKPSLLDTLPPYLGGGYSSKYLYAYAQSDDEDAGDEMYEDFITDANEADKNGVTRLMRAARNGNSWEVSALLRSGATVDAHDKDGWTALMYAVRYQMDTTVVKALLDAGADAKRANKYGFTSLAIAARYNDNPSVSSAVLDKFEAGDDEVFRALIALITATSSEEARKAKMRVFMEYGVPVNRYWEGKTPLMYAASSCSSTDCIEMLLDNGAISTLATSDGKKAFDFAKLNSSLPHDDVFWSLGSGRR